ncbi:MULTISPECIES: hypothetical protein [Bifidobacterium]|nr:MULTISPECIES: hypothetical protein [Bifidobacterium]MDK7091462.1 hypothetical protein [Bifidobacterium breve]MEE4089534.1 hypothetical protein [Bifidobacterium longum subsp. infantis]
MNSITLYSFPEFMASLYAVIAIVPASLLIALSTQLTQAKK